MTETEFCPMSPTSVPPRGRKCGRRSPISRRSRNTGSASRPSATGSRARPGASSSTTGAPPTPEKSWRPFRTSGWSSATGRTSSSRSSRRQAARVAPSSPRSPSITRATAARRSSSTITHEAEAEQGAPLIEAVSGGWPKILSNLKLLPRPAQRRVDTRVA